LDTVDPPLTKVAENHTGTSYRATGLEDMKTYYWTVKPYEGALAGDCISGVWSFDLDLSAPPTQDYGVEITMDITEVELEQGASDTYTVTVTNIGNGEDLIIVSIDSGTAKQYGSLSDTAGITLASNASSQLDLTITIPADLAVDNYTIVLKAVGGGDAEDTYTLNVRVVSKDTPPQVDDDDDDTEGGLSGMTIFLIVALIVIIVLFIIVVLFLVMKRKKDQEEMREKELKMLEEGRKEEAAVTPESDMAAMEAQFTGLEAETGPEQGPQDDFMASMEPMEEPAGPVMEESLPMEEVPPTEGEGPESPFAAASEEAMTAEEPAMEEMPELEMTPEGEVQEGASEEDMLEF
jgi:hypothetical protein